MVPPMPGAPARPEIPDILALGIANLNRATLDGDFDDARLSLAQIREKLAEPELAPLREIADQLAKVLGPCGTQPGKGLGRALVSVTETLRGPVWFW